ncbi:MAG: glycosyltransferase family 39 protein [Chitinophagaceae bacterium]|nr:glycosyltransferase family 39 protein [Chitinophagaceae bacterium]
MSKHFSLNHTFTKIPGASVIIFSILLLFPFVFVYLYSGGLPFSLDTSFASDEPIYHYPTILKFAEQLPFPDVSDYNSATTPLFHLVFAAASKIIGTDIQTLRLFNVLISCVILLILFKILQSRFKLTKVNAFLFAFIFACSPYYFREAFVVVTDNFPVLWLLCFFNFYFKYKEEHNQRFFLLSAFFLLLLCLTRQTYLFVCIAVIIDQLLRTGSTSKKIKNSAWILLASLPTLIFFFIWKGLTPPTFANLHTRESLVNIKVFLYGLSILGFYSLFIPSLSSYGELFTKKNMIIKVVCLVVSSWIVLFFLQIVKDPKDFGYIWHIAESVPELANSSLLFYILMPMGVITLLNIWQKEGISFLILFLVGLFISEMPNKIIFQRYYDNSILISLIFFSARYYESCKIDLYRRVILIVFFITYFVIYVMVYK